MASNSNASRNYEFQIHKRGKPLRSSAKVIVMNIYHKLKEQHPEKSQKDVVQLVSNLSGVSVASINRMQHEFQVKGVLSTPGKKRPSSAGKATRVNKYDEFTLSAIRRKVHFFYKRNEIPTAAKIMKVVNEDNELPTLSVRTVQRLLGDLGFVFRKRSRTSALIEREDIQTWRRQYLREIRRYRAEGRRIYYTDETWVNFGHTKSTVWQDSSIKTPKQAFLEGLTTGLKAPTGKGSRLIITHAGSEKGFVDSACEIFKAKKSVGDYHSEMNGRHYEDWFEKRLLPNLEPNSVIVLDNAPYHSVFEENIPNSSTKKADIQSWLTSKNISWTQDMLKAELLFIVSGVRKNYQSYRIDSLAAICGHKVLRLPPYHCELNPIELIWAQIKGFVAAENATFKEGEVQILTENAIKRVGPAEWSACIKHVIEEESRMWEMDGLIDITVESLQFTVDSESTETAIDSESDDSQI